LYIKNLNENSISLRGFEVDFNLNLKHERSKRGESGKKRIRASATLPKLHGLTKKYSL
jgi:hypothetical protein